MIGVLVADSAPETNDLGAWLVEESAVEQTLIDKLVGAAVAGDSAARDQLVAELYPLVLRYCRRRLSRRESVLGSADDVAQEICLAVVAALRSYVISGRSFRSFAYGIAANKVADAFRAMSRNRTEPMADLPDGPILHDGPEQRLLDGELAERLAGLLQLLPPRQRKVLVLRIAVGLSAEETAEEPAPPRSLGDAGSTPNSKTGAAIRKQAPVLVENLLAAKGGRELTAKYDGYASCPITTAHNRMLLCEFDYSLQPRPTVPLIDTTHERYDMWLLKRYGLPFMYWNLMLKGRA